ncbi:hypothetical protein H4Q26_000743 [Puccinia striiformis f. sp. tritici PST-130]|nr:hypothetical protein H4Q26_000743 [Puccinia striiformis f. sp. tritici PST-130]
MSSFESSVVSPTQATSHQASPPTTQSNPDAEGSIFAHQKWNSTAHEPQLYLARLPTVTPASDINSARSLQLGVPRPKRKRITPEQLEVLSNLFEYTDTPTFDLREAIGAKLGMSNREVQVWFQNRRAKVNRQRAPTNTQATLQDRPPPSTSQQDPSRVTYGRLKCSSSEVLLPGVSTMIHSSTDASRSTYSLAPLLPPFQPTAPGSIASKMDWFVDLYAIALSQLLDLPRHKTRLAPIGFIGLTSNYEVHPAHIDGSFLSPLALLIPASGFPGALQKPPAMIIPPLLYRRAARAPILSSNRQSSPITCPVIILHALAGAHIQRDPV